MILEMYIEIYTSKSNLSMRNEETVGENRGHKESDPTRRKVEVIENIRHLHFHLWLRTFLSTINIGQPIKCAVKLLPTEFIR